MSTEPESLRVLMTIMVFHPIVGGTEISAKELAASLVRRGHRVEVVTLRQPGLPAHEVLDGVSVHRALWGIGRGAVFVLGYVLSLGWFLLRRAGRYDLLHVHYAYLDAVTASLLQPCLRVKTIVRFGGGGPSGDLGRLRRLGLDRLFLPLIRRLDRFVVVSQRMREELLEAEFDPARIRVIPNGVDTARFTPSLEPHQERSRLGVSGPTALTVARLSPEKGLDVLLEAWRVVTAQRPGVRLLVVGNGPQRETLERTAQQAGLDGTVAFVGAVHDVRPYLGAGDLFVLPSLAEGMPNALLQAMAVGLPCVATRVGGIPELIEDRINGRLVAAGDPEALAEALLSVLRHPEDAARYGRAARQTVVSRLTMDRMVERYLEVYHQLLGTGENSQGGTWKG